MDESSAGFALAQAEEIKRLRAELTEAERHHEEFVDESNAEYNALQARLDAVIALCDDTDATTGHTARRLAAKVHAAATGETR
jgi:hypothetical protein